MKKILTLPLIVSYSQCFTLLVQYFCNISFPDMFFVLYWFVFFFLRNFSSAITCSRSQKWKNSMKTKNPIVPMTKNSSTRDRQTICLFNSKSPIYSIPGCWSTLDDSQLAIFKVQLTLFWNFQIESVTCPQSPWIYLKNNALLFRNIPYFRQKSLLQQLRRLKMKFRTGEA